MNKFQRIRKARRRPVFTSTLLLAGWLAGWLAGFSLTAAAANTAPIVLKEMPAKGMLRLGEVIYVDDETCPVGDVKKISGGNQKTGVPRQVECVKRPEGS